MNAPHIRVSVVMPGHISTGIRDNSLKVQTHSETDRLNAAQIAQIRARLTSMGHVLPNARPHHDGMVWPQRVARCSLLPNRDPAPSGSAAAKQLSRPAFPAAA